jgi:hypothetical protein
LNTRLGQFFGVLSITEEAAMLRVNIVESGKELKIVLYGKLSEPWISEAQIIWSEMRQSLENAVLIVDLTEITSVDLKGKLLLSEMLQAGAQFVTSGVFMSYLIHSLHEGKAN